MLFMYLFCLTPQEPSSSLFQHADTFWINQARLGSIEQIEDMLNLLYLVEIKPWPDIVNKGRSLDFLALPTHWIELQLICIKLDIYMRQHKTSLEEDHEQDLQDIFKILAELDKPKVHQQLHKQQSNRSNISKNKEKEVNKVEPKCRPILVSNKKQSLNKKSSSIEPIKFENQQNSLKNQSNSYLNPRSNISAQFQFQEQNANERQKPPIVEPLSFITKSSSEKMTKQNKAVGDLQKKLQQYQQGYKQKEKIFLEEKKRQKQVMSTVLRESFKRKIEYHQYLDYINEQRKSIMEKEFQQKSQPLLKSSKEEELKYKPRKKIKNAQTMSLSDEQQSKISELMDKQKKYYFSIVGSKIEKQRQKIENNLGNKDVKKLAALSEQRTHVLKKDFSLLEIEPLCQIQGPSQKVSQILGVDLQKCSQVRIKSYPFNPTNNNQQRIRIYEQFLQAAISSKKITPNSNHHLFNQSSSLFIPSSHVVNRQDEILVINECGQTYFSLGVFLRRLELSPGEQQLHIARYIARMCLKGIQQINSELKRDNITILPHNIYFNEKWELKLSNICFNELIYHHFKHTLHEHDHYYFPPEETPDRYSSSLWSLGMLIYFLCFAGLPFQKYQPYHYKSREEFFMFNQLQVSHKSGTYDKCKDFIVYCLNKRGSINFNEVCSEHFFTQTK